jgi:hypothetical protein
MRPVTVSQTGAGSTVVVPPDIYVSPCNIALGVVVTGTVNYTVQHTFDDVFAPTFTPGSAIWFNHPTLAAQTANADSNYAFPPRGIRLTVNSGSGTAALTIVQSGVGQ